MTLKSKHQRLAELRPLATDAVRSLREAWDVRMVYESNSIEGNTLTLRETEMVLSKGITVANKPLKDHLEALNLSAAWEQVKALAKPQAQLTESTLLDLHRMVLTRTDDANAGRYRTHAVRISGAQHVPPNPIKVPQLMENLFANLPPQNLPPQEQALERAARLHYGIASIHPFTDGNGRSARLAMNFVLLSAGFPPLSIDPQQRAAYYAALEAADQGNFANWQDFLEQGLHQELDFWLEALSPLSN